MVRRSNYSNAYRMLFLVVVALMATMMMMVPTTTMPLTVHAFVLKNNNRGIDYPMTRKIVTPSSPTRVLSSNANALDSNPLYDDVTHRDRELDDEVEAFLCSQLSASRLPSRPAT